MTPREPRAGGVIANGAPFNRTAMLRFQLNFEQAGTTCLDRYAEN